MHGKRFLFIFPSSAGFVYPGIRLAQALQSQNNEVLFIGSSHFDALMRFYGIDFIGISHIQKELPFLHISKWYNLQANLEQHALLEKVSGFFHVDAVICSPLNISALVWCEQHRIPVILLGFATRLFPSGTGEEFDRKWRLGEFLKYFNQLRERVSPSIVYNDPPTGSLIGDLLLCRSIPSLEPGNVPGEKIKFIGSSCYWDPPVQNVRLRRFMMENRKRERPLIYIQLGRFFDQRDRCFELVEMLTQMPFDFIADTGRADYDWQKTTSSTNMFAHTFIPVGAVADQAAAMITSAQTTGFLAGIVHRLPHLAIPFSAEGKEIATLIKKMSIGAVIDDEQDFSIDALKNALDSLLNDGPINSSLEKFHNEFANQVTMNGICECIHQTISEKS